MPVVRQTPDHSKFNADAELPFELRLADFEVAMQDVYDFLYDVNRHLVSKGLARLDDMLRAANLSGMLSDMLTESLAKHSRTLVVNAHHNGHPDLLVRGQYENDSAKAGEAGVEVKTTKKRGGAVDTHGGRDQWMCVFVYDIDNDTEPAVNRRALVFREVYLAHVSVEDFRRNERGELGTRTSTLDKDGVKVLRENWIYLDKIALAARKVAAKKAPAAKKAAPAKKSAAARKRPVAAKRTVPAKKAPAAKKVTRRPS